MRGFYAVVMHQSVNSTEASELVSAALVTAVAYLRVQRTHTNKQIGRYCS